MKTYWEQSPRGFANEYVVGIATTPASAQQYAAEGYVRISRREALRAMSRVGDVSTAVYCAATLDGESVDRFGTARALRGGYFTKGRP